MNIENRTTKVYLKSLPPLTAIELIENYKIPSPLKEVLLTACVARKEGFKGCDYLAKTYHVYLGYWTFGVKLKKALEMFRKSHAKYYKDVDFL